tara:strand:+ start:105 stop:764 length:660 start_codon:yes stop_codon:yes gene_type:complete
MEENTTHLYLHTKKGTEEVFYVGIGNAKRPYRKDSRNKWWHNVVNKYGYEITILADNLTWTQACDMEIYLIGYYGRGNSSIGTLVNLTDGGEGIKGSIMSAETRAKMSASHKGKQHSEETKAKIGAASKGKKISKEQRAKLSALKKGKLSNSTKLTEVQVIEILTELRDNTYRGQNVDLGLKYGVKSVTISAIKTNRTWKHICRDTLKRVITKVLITAQ